MLCQQHLNHEAVVRLNNFEQFVQSRVEKELQELRIRFDEMRKGLIDLLVQPEVIVNTIKEIEIESKSIASRITKWLSAAEARREALVNAVREDRDLAECPELCEIPLEINQLENELDERITNLRKSDTGEIRNKLSTEAEELKARVMLGKNTEVVLEEIERLKKIAAYERCRMDTQTHSITRKSKEITKEAVTEKLKDSFRSELSRLGFQQAEVELSDAGGAAGIHYHKIVLSQAPDVELPKVISEGEQRCLAVAAFFAELSTEQEPSGIVFDDPVSSLDYKWRDAVARRLVEEAKTRQVIVFTHDIVFLLALKEFSDKIGVNQSEHHVRRLAHEAGVVSGELPWVAMKVSKRIGYLKNEWQSAEKLHRTGKLDKYEREAGVIYGLLREAWERALEEVLLSGVVERFRPGVQTMQVGDLADITQKDCDLLEKAMTKCSVHLIGHDQAAAARTEMPEPSELLKDIDELETWVNEIRGRRG